MSVLDLRKLHKLHQVDVAIHEIRKRAEALDPGKRIQAEINGLTADFNAKDEAAKKYASELSDLELKQKGIDDKLKKIDKDLYGGKVVNPREVENLQKEIGILKNQRGDLDLRILELWDLAPPARKAAEEVQALIDAKKKELAEYQKKVVQAKAQLEAQYKEQTAKRPALAAEVPKPLLARYDAIRQKMHGVGMAEVIKGGNCSRCGTHLPLKIVEDALDGRVVTCESCHRIIYASEGLV